ncbi:hypothetical protein Q5O14_06740 [Eubacteriaceae bacterium ES2]|nr:hypothetical protein Q5O14_06740 [Eubacteriaceae bacterium ES2]
MNELDKMIKCLGFDENNIYDFADRIPFETKVDDIMYHIQRSSKNPFEQWLVFGYIILIAFAACMTRLFVMGESIKQMINALLIGMLYYADAIVVAAKISSFCISFSILLWVMIGIFQYKNEKVF